MEECQRAIEFAGHVGARRCSVKDQHIAVHPNMALNRCKSEICALMDGSYLAVAISMQFAGNVEDVVSGAEITTYQMRAN